MITFNAFETNRKRRVTHPLPTKSITIDLIFLSEDDIIEESEATSRQFKEGDQNTHQDNTDGPTDPVIPEGNEA
jgi:hypothetical protein